MFEGNRPWFASTYTSSSTVLSFNFLVKSIINICHFTTLRRFWLWQWCTKLAPYPPSSPHPYINVGHNLFNMIALPNLFFFPYSKLSSCTWKSGGQFCAGRKLSLINTKIAERIGKLGAPAGFYYCQHTQESFRSFPSIPPPNYVTRYVFYRQLCQHLRIKSPLMQQE